MIKNLILPSNFRFSDRKFQRQQKLAKKDHPFYNTAIQFHSKNLTHFTNLNSLNIMKNILPKHSQKHISGWCQKKNLHCIISRRPRTAFLELMERKCLYIPVNLRLKICNGRLNNFLNEARCLGLVK